MDVFQVAEYKEYLFDTVKKSLASIVQAAIITQ